MLCFRQVMKALSYIALLFLLAGCASPYYTVPVSSSGDYYIAERQTGGSYYGSNSLLYDDLGIHPWWMSSYPVELFSYYSPYYYPYYFSVWQPPGFHPFHGFYGRYYAYWCPPYRPRLYREPDPVNQVVTRQAKRPPAIVTYPDITELRRWNDLATVNRVATSSGMKSRRTGTWETGGSTSSLPVYSRNTPSTTRSSGIGRSTTRSSRSTRSARPIAGKPYATHKQ